MIIFNDRSWCCTGRTKFIHSFMHSFIHWYAYIHNFTYLWSLAHSVLFVFPWICSEDYNAIIDIYPDIFHCTLLYSFCNWSLPSTIVDYFFTTYMCPWPDVCKLSCFGQGIYNIYVYTKCLEISLQRSWRIMSQLKHKTIKLDKTVGVWLSKIFNCILRSTIN